MPETVGSGAIGGSGGSDKRSYLKLTFDSVIRMKISEMSIGTVQVGSTLTLEHVIRDQNLTVVNLNEATNITVNVRKPSGEVLEIEGAQTNEGTDGVLSALLAASDNDQIGTWTSWATVEFQDDIVYNSRPLYWEMAANGNA